MPHIWGMFRSWKIFAELMNIVIDKETEAHWNEIPTVSQLSRGCSSPKYPELAPCCHVCFGVHTQTVVRKNKICRGEKSTSWNFGILALENSYSLGSDAGYSRTFQHAGTLCRPLRVTGYIWVSSEAVTRNREDSSEIWLPKVAGLSLMRCHIEYLDDSAWT